MTDGTLSKNALDRLGSRLRNDVHPSDDDLLLLDSYRERFRPVTAEIVSTLRAVLPYPLEPRPHKSIPSIIAKLRRRQPARLSAIQDMAGARIVIPSIDLNIQDTIVQQIVERFPNSTIDDRRLHPSYGYLRET